MSPEQSASKIGKSVGEKLRAARIAQHYTQSQLAAPDFSVSYISAIERGQIHPSLRALEILAGRLGLSSTQLLPARGQQDDRQSSPISTERDDDEVELALLEAHILIREGATSQAVTQLEKLSSKRLKRPHQLLHRYLLGWAYYKTAQFQESDYTLSEAAQLAKELNANHLHLRILNLLAMGQAAMRNYAQALLAHQRCINLLESVEPYDPFFTIQIYVYMGQHYTHLNNFGQAQETFQKALAIAEKLATTAGIQAAYWQLCQYYASNKETELATLYAFKSFHLHDLREWKYLRSEIYYYLGRSMLKGDPETARAYLDKAQHDELVTKDPLSCATVLAREAEWHFERGQFEPAQGYAQQACDLAQPYGDTIIGADALIIHGRIAYAQQHYDEGHQYFAAGLDMLERIDQHEELADESVRYAQQLEEIGKPHEAFTYFRKAFQSKQKIGK